MHASESAPHAQVASPPPRIAPKLTPAFREIGDSHAKPVRRLAKAARLVGLLAPHPIEFYDRVRAIAEIKARRRWPTSARYESSTWEDLAAQAARVLPGNVSWSREDPAIAEIYEQLTERMSSLGSVPFLSVYSGDPILTRLTYMLTLALKPQVVIESGVALGVVSSFILSAMQQNGCGRLISIDLPPLGVTVDETGLIIPPELRSRWTLIRGSSVRVLPSILRELPPVGLFVHDSLFTRRNSRQEYSLVLPHLAERSAVVGNCVHHSDAFDWLGKQSRPAAQLVLAGEQKTNEQIGVCIYRDGARGEQ